MAAESTAGPELLTLDDDSPEAVLALFESRGWGDGLPLVAPTAERDDVDGDAGGSEGCRAQRA